MGIGNELKNMVFKRTGIKEDELVCPREKSDMTPCVARDGDLAMTENGKCVGCGVDVYTLLTEERNKSIEKK